MADLNRGMGAGDPDIGFSFRQLQIHLPRFTTGPIYYGGQVASGTSPTGYTPKAKMDFGALKRKLWFAGHPKR
jgi:hypothetical protein